MISLLPFLAYLATANNANKGEGTGNAGNGRQVGLGPKDDTPKCRIRAPLVFSPSSLDFKDSDGPQSFTVSLASAPSRPVTYHFDGNNMNFDKCSVTFDENNWEQPQVINTIPTLYKGADTTFRFNITAVGRNGKKVKGNIPVVRHAMRAPVAQSSGDPHFTLFDTNPAPKKPTVISQQKRAVNYLFKSPDFDVMAAQDQCIPYSKAYCNKAVVIRFGDAWYTYDSRTLTANGKILKPYHNGLGRDGFVSTPPHGKQSTYEFTIPDGSSVSVFPSADTKLYGVHNTVKISLHPSMAVKGQGILNTPYQSGSVLRNADGTVGAASKAADQKKFFESWEVPAANNFFAGNHSELVPSSMPAFQSCSSNGHAVVKRDLDDEEVEYDGTWENRNDKEEAPATFTDAEIKEANSKCNSVFAGAASCEKVISSEGYKMTCANDYLLTKDVTLAQDHLEDYLLECAETVKSLTNVDAEIDAALLTVCPKDCSSNGECTEGGCVCKPGFLGSDCSSHA